MIEYQKKHLLALLEAMEKELKKNEFFLRQTHNFYSHHQDEPYRRLYGLLKEAKETTARMEKEI